MHLGQQSALVDGLSLKELGDSVLVEIEPQRKGLSFLKHVEYRIVSKVNLTFYIGLDTHIHTELHKSG